ncbi:hypothetical protein EGT09_06925 [Pseudomonas putida]|nr:hypothetical protein EGT09_06925 [Pseudomonas putida]
MARSKGFFGSALRRWVNQLQQERGGVLCRVEHNVDSLVRKVITLGLAPWFSQPSTEDLGE